MHARCPATAASTVGNELFTQHWAAALPTEAAAAVVLSRWCTVVSLEVECYASSLRASPPPGGWL